MHDRLIAVLLVASLSCRSDSGAARPPVDAGPRSCVNLPTEQTQGLVLLGWLRERQAARRHGRMAFHDDERILALLTALCGPRISGPGFSARISDFSLEELFPLELVDVAALAECGGLTVRGDDYPGARVLRGPAP